MNRYEQEGRRARSRGMNREDCRYKKPEIREAWLGGWDQKDGELARAKAERDAPGWSKHYISGGVYAYGTKGVGVPTIGLHPGRDGGWFFRFHPDEAGDRLDVEDAETAKAEAIKLAKAHLREMLEGLERVEDSES